jgi:antitoxin HicB
MDIAYTVVFDRNEAGGYTVTVPALPGLVSEGSTLPEAKTMAVDAIRCYVEGLIKDGEPIPREREVLHERMQVEVAGT